MSSTGTLTLAPWPVDAARRLVAGQPLAPAATAAWHPQYPTPDSVDALAMVLAAHAASLPGPPGPPWWVYEIRLAGQVVGDAGFHGPPADAGPVEVEIGYAVVPALRGRGIAGRACALLLERAWHAGADRVLADTEPGNVASRAVLVGRGFVERTGGGFVADRPAGSR